MANTPSIRIDQGDTGTTGQSRTDLSVSVQVDLVDTANSSGSYTWTLVTPATSSATLTGANTATPSFTPDVTGNYLVFCEVDGIRSFSVTATGAKDSTQGGCGVLEVGEQIAAPGETRQFDSTNGWAAGYEGVARIALAGAGGGQSNTASNVGTAGVGLFKSKVGVDLQFKKVNAGSSKITITDDTGNDEVDIDVDESNFSAASIKTVYESNADTNAFTDADESKLDGIEANATADQTGAEIKTAYEGEANTNAFTDAEQTKLSGIETAADVTDATNVDAAGAVMHTDVSEASGLLRKTASETYVANDTLDTGVGTTVTTVTDGATLTIDCSDGNVFKVTLGGNRTVAAPTNPRNGQVIQFFVIQDATGSRTLTWNAIFRWPSSTAPTLTTDANAIDIVSAVYDGSAWFATSALDFG